MGKALISLLLSAALVPATTFAQDGDHEPGSRSRAERSKQDDNRHVNRAQRPEGAQRQERESRSEAADPRNVTVDRAPVRASQQETHKGSDRGDRAGGGQRVDRPDRSQLPAPVEREATDVRVIEQPLSPEAVRPTSQDRGGSDSLLDGFRQVGRDQNSRRDDRDHDGRNRDKDRDWSKDWRKNDRYDWWKYRNRYRSLYRLGRYNDPYGWGYRRWSIGYSLWPSHYRSNFWLNDPWMYRLPPAYGPYRWVRYYDDALLVNIYTGNVVDVVYNFFW